jgi:septal ring factor EnvC (AmiA/AmiB activator)
MKHTKLIFALVLALFVAGCDKSGTTSADASTSQQLDQMKQDAKQTADDISNYTYAQKQEFITKMQAEVDELNAEFAQLSAKIAKASDATKAAAQPKLDDLKAQMAALNTDLDQAKASTETTWDQVKASVQKGYDSTKQAFVNAGQWIDKQVSS